MHSNSERVKTEQEQFWAGTFGDEYTVRNTIDPAQRCPFFKRILDLALPVQSVCELGANQGHNLLALQLLTPILSLTGVELNPVAFQKLSNNPGIQAIHSSIQDFESECEFDLVVTCGVLIHLPPSHLPDIYRKMAALSQRYILINEYYNPTPLEISYRGHSDKLFKRDFGGEFLDCINGTVAATNQIRLVDYGFLWQRVHPAWDNTTWWLFEKQTS